MQLTMKFINFINIAIQINARDFPRSDLGPDIGQMFRPVIKGIITWVKVQNVQNPEFSKLHS